MGRNARPSEALLLDSTGSATRDNLLDVALERAEEEGGRERVCRVVYAARFTGREDPRGMHAALLQRHAPPAGGGSITGLLMVHSGAGCLVHLMEARTEVLLGILQELQQQAGSSGLAGVRVLLSMERVQRCCRGWFASAMPGTGSSASRPNASASIAAAAGAEAESEDSEESLELAVRVCSLLSKLGTTLSALPEADLQRCLSDPAAFLGPDLLPPADMLLALTAVPGGGGAGSSSCNGNAGGARTAPGRAAAAGGQAAAGGGAGSGGAGSLPSLQVYLALYGGVLDSGLLLKAAATLEEDRVWPADRPLVC